MYSKVDSIKAKLTWDSECDSVKYALSDVCIYALENIITVEQFSQIEFSRRRVAYSWNPQNLVELPANEFLSSCSLMSYKWSV